MKGFGAVLVAFLCVGCGSSSPALGGPVGAIHVGQLSEKDAIQAAEAAMLRERIRPESLELLRTERGNEAFTFHFRFRHRGAFEGVVDVDVNRETAETRVLRSE